MFFLAALLHYYFNYLLLQGYDTEKDVLKPSFYRIAMCYFIKNFNSLSFNNKNWRATNKLSNQEMSDYKL